MSQSKEDKSDSENESSNESKSGSGSSDSESESGSGSGSSSSSSDNEEEVNSSLNTTSANDNAHDGSSSKPAENGNASEDEDEESDGHETSGARNHNNTNSSGGGGQLNNSDETNDKSRSSAQTGSGSEDSDNNSEEAGNHSDSEDSGKPSNASQSQDDDDDDDSASNNSNEDEDQHSSKSSYDDEDYAANKRRQNARKKAAAAQAKRKASASQPKKKKPSSRWKSDTSDESDASEPDNSSDEDASYGAARKAPPKKRPAPPPKARPKPKKKRAAYSSDEGSAGSGEEQSRPGRNRGKTAVSYKEESGDEQTDSEDLLEVDPEVAEAAAAAAAEDEKTETIERIIGQRVGKKTATGAATTIYSVEESGDPNEDVDEKDKEGTEPQYLIKWTNWSYWHCTWESEESLKEQRVKGMKKLENYIKREKDIEYWRKYQAGPEDIDYYECQQELQQDLVKSYYNVERVIAQAEKPEGGKDYLCKWESLPYADSTWEDASLIMKKWVRKVEEFHEREESRRTPSKHCRVIKSRPKFHHLKAQPEYLGEDRGLKLRDYQMDGLNWLILTWCKENSVILADEMGLGKTIQTICFLYYLFKAQQLYGPFLCVVPLSTMTAWQREFTIWAPEMNVVTYLGDVASREMIRQYEWCFDNQKLKFNAILTTYEILLKDKTFLGSISWAALLVDEAHRLKNDDSLLYKALEEFDTNYRLLITGTPLQNSLKELWALLHFIMPQRFDAWDAFDRLYGNTTNDKSYTKLHKELEPYILRRVKKDVEKSLPAKVEQILRVEMTSIQRQYYRWILTKNFDALRKGMKGSINTFLNIVIELKKCCNHALLTRPTEFETATAASDDVVVQLLKGSGKLVLLDKLLCRLKETGHRVLIFSQMVRMLDILAEYLQKRHFSFQRLDGSIKGELRKQALDHFNAEGSTDFCFLLSTRAGGLGINLATADTVIIFDSDWNPQNDLQAQARAHRIGQKNQVNIYRLVTAKSVEEEIVERAKKKMVLDHLVIQRMDTTGRTVLDKNGANNTANPFNKDELSAILKFGAEELFKEDEDGEGDELVCDIDEILKRAETRDEAPGMPGDELLSAFNVTTFDFDEEKETSAIRKPTAKAPVEAEQDDTKDWDEIIPQKLRERVEAEERNKELNDLYLPPRRQTLKQLNQANEEGGASGKKRKKRQAEEESDEESDAGSEEDKPSGKKTGTRGRPSNKEKITGFNDTELRRFIKSYKKFPAPLKRLEAIAMDAELQEKPLSELKRVAELLQERCVQFMEHSKENEEKEKNSQDDKAKKAGPRAAFSIRFGGVSFNVKTLLQCVEELTPLDEFLPTDADERAKWVLNIKTRPANFDVEWTNEDDSRLLRGIYQFGIGSWEAMKLEDSLALGDKILSNDGEKKPQAKHLQSRSEYLLKIIRKNLELKKGNGKKPRKPRKPRGEGKAISAAIVHSPSAPSSKDDLADGTNDGSSNEDTSRKAKTKKVSESDAHHHEHDASSNGPKEAETKESHKKERKKKEKASKDTKKSKKNTGPMHFTANNEPAQLNIIGDLDPSIFNECKEKMRPVKKALKTLDNPDQTLSAEEQVNQTRACLLSIGNQINQCISVYKDSEKVKEWRSNLWYFVSKFTEFDAKKLFKLYKHALKRSEGKEGGSANSGGGGSAEKKKDHHHHHHHHHHHAKDGTGSAQNSPVKEKAAKNVPGTPQALQTLGKIKKISKKDNGQQQQGPLVVSTPLAESPSSGERRREKKRNLGSRGTPDRGGTGPPDDHRKDRYLGQDGAEESDGHSKRKLEEGELAEENSKEYKRLHGDGRNSRDRDKKWDDYGDRERASMRMGGRSGGAPGTPQGVRGGIFSDGGARGPYPDERWSGRDRFSDHKRDRYDSYNRHPPSGYHRDHRERERGDRSYKDKRRYPPSGAGAYPNNHYGMPPSGYYPPGDNPYRYAAGYDRGGGVGSGGPPGSGGSTGGRGSDYDRRQPPSGNT